MCEGIVDRMTNRSVWDLIRIEPRPGIGDSAGKHVLVTDVFNFNVFSRIELATVLDSIHQHFAESIAHLLALRGGKIGYLIEKLHEANCCVLLTTRPNTNPLGIAG